MKCNTSPPQGVACARACQIRTSVPSPHPGPDSYDFRQGRARGRQVVEAIDHLAVRLRHDLGGGVTLASVCVFCLCIYVFVVFAKRRSLRVCVRNRLPLQGRSSRGRALRQGAKEGATPGTRKVLPPLYVSALVPCALLPQIWAARPGVCASSC